MFAPLERITLEFTILLDIVNATAVPRMTAHAKFEIPAINLAFSGEVSPDEIVVAIIVPPS